MSLVDSATSIDKFAIMFQISGLILGAASVFTYYDHGILLTVIPTKTYFVIILLIMSTAGLILVNSLIGFLGSKYQLKSFLIMVS